MAFERGTRLGRYTIEALLGTGGMGEVYRAHDTRLKRDVAVKVLPDVSARDAEHLSRFAREAELLASLSHPNLAAIHAIDDYEGRPFIVMELLTGRTLRALIDGPALPTGRIVELALEMADGLTAAHARGIVHRDIKPENIYVVESGHAKILDFGVAKLVTTRDWAMADLSAVTGLTEPGAAVGTVSYMSPEQVRGDAVDARTDLFSLGVVLYEMTSGRRPFSGSTSGVVFEAILNRAPIPLERLNSAVPPELQRITHKLMEKDCRLRYQSAADVRADLEHLKRELDASSRSSMAPSATADRSIVVMPFTDLSPGKDKEYFADGLADEIIIDLSQLQAIRVISRNSSMQLKATSWDLKRIAQELRVQYVLEGTVRTAGDNLRVTAQLVDAATGQNLWADKYAGKLEDVFDIQERISRQIVEALKMKLSPGEDRRIADRQITNLQAYECYQLARQDIYAFTEAGLDHALHLIQDALRIVGDNELLYAALGMVYWQYVNAAIKPEDRFLDMAEECAEKVFRLKPESASGFLLIGLIQLTRGRQTDARNSLLRVMAIEPNNANALGELFRIYLVAGPEGELRRTLDRALAIDPLSVVNPYMVFAAEFFYGTPEKAKLVADQMLERVPDYAILRFIYALWLVQSGQIKEAQALLARAPKEPMATIAGGCCRFFENALDGKRAEALASIPDDLKIGARRVEWWSFYLAECYGLLGHTDEALDWLENAVRLGFVNFQFLGRRDTILAKLRGHPRYDALMTRVEEAWESGAGSHP